MSQRKMNFFCWLDDSLSQKNTKTIGYLEVTLEWRKVDEKFSEKT